MRVKITYTENGKSKLLLATNDLEIAAKAKAAVIALREDPNTPGKSKRVIVTEIFPELMAKYLNSAEMDVGEEFANSLEASRFFGFSYNYVGIQLATAKKNGKYYEQGEGGAQGLIIRGVRLMWSYDYHRD